MRCGVPDIFSFILFLFICILINLRILKFTAFDGEIITFYAWLTYKSYPRLKEILMPVKMVFFWCKLLILNQRYGFPKSSAGSVPVIFSSLGLYTELYYTGCIKKKVIEL